MGNCGTKTLQKVLRPTDKVDAFLLENQSRVAEFLPSTRYTYSSDNPAPPPPPSTSAVPGSGTVVRVVEKDCLVDAGELVKCGKFRNVAVLNMANEYNCGGAFSVHKGSQEEYIFRNSTLSVALWNHRRVTQEMDREWTVGTKLTGYVKEPWYPFTLWGGIYTPKIEVFALQDEFIPSDDRFQCAVLTIAAQDLRRSQEKFDPALLKEKLRTMFYMAAENGCDALVLGAIGCGAFLNPPDEVVKVFKELLDGEYKDYFAQVDFAIIKSVENLKAFEKVYGKAQA